jgi:phosphatidylserine decarboxylase
MIAKEGIPFILIGLGLTIAAIWAGTRWDSFVLLGVSALFALVTVFVTFFFRDPARSCPDDAGLIISPADGAVLLVDTLDSHPVVGPQTIKISIFLSVMNVHVNRAPVSGRVDYVKYVPGKFLVAYADKASDENEHTEIGMTDRSNRKVVFKQIAGTIARRIVCRIHQGDELRIGDRFGLIRFGSRMDIFLPAGSRISVKKGDKLRGGESVIGYFPPESSGKPTNSINSGL